MQQQCCCDYSFLFLQLSATEIDLRFVPDDIEFTEEPRDVATEVPEKYEAPQFHANALGSTSVQCNWDDDKVTAKASVVAIYSFFVGETEKICNGLEKYGVR